MHVIAGGLFYSLFECTFLKISLEKINKKKKQEYFNIKLKINKPTNRHTHTRLTSKCLVHLHFLTYKLKIFLLMVK